MVEYPVREIEPQKLIVVLPDSLAGNLDLAHKIHWIATREKRPILFLTLVDDLETILSKSRSMATLAAAASTREQAANVRLVKTTDWLKTLREMANPGDVIVCQAEQTVRTGFLRVASLGEYIRANFSNRVLMVEGFYRPARDQILWVTSQILFGLGVLAILALFTLLEIYLDRQLTGPLHTIILGAVICIEFGAMYLWNRLISR